MRLMLATGAMSRMKLKLSFSIECRIDRIRSAGQEEGVAVRWRTHDRLGGDIAAGTRPVVDEELLTETVREPLSHQARDDVDLAPSRKADDNAHRPRRIACAHAKRDTAGSAAAPAARCKNLRRGSFIDAPPSPASARASSVADTPRPKLAASDRMNERRKLYRSLWIASTRCFECESVRTFVYRPVNAASSGFRSISVTVTPKSSACLRKLASQFFH